MYACIPTGTYIMYVYVYTKGGFRQYLVTDPMIGILLGERILGSNDYNVND